MGTYGTKNGIVIWRDTDDVARVATLKAGEIQAALIADGLTWANGKGQADSSGVRHVDSEDAYWKVEPDSIGFMYIYIGKDATNRNYALHIINETGDGLQCQGLLAGVIGFAGLGNGDGTGSTGDGVYGYTLEWDNTTPLGSIYDKAGVLGTSQKLIGVAGRSYTGTGVYGFAEDAGGVGIKAEASGSSTTALKIIGGDVDGGAQLYTNLADATADTDALNRRTGDGRYAPLASVLELASQSETEAGTITNKAVPPAYLALRKIGSGWALGTGGNNRGADALDLQSSRGVSSQVASGSRATISGGYSNTASGTQATVVGGVSNMATDEGAVVIGGDSNAATEAFATVGGGGDNVAAGQNATVVGGYDNAAEGSYATVGGGRQGYAALYGQQAHAAGQFAARGDAQRSDYVLRNATSNATQTELFLDGVGERLTLSDDTTWFFEARIAARRTDANNESAAYILQGCLDRNAGTVALVGSVAKIILAEDTSAWDVTAEADNTNKALVIKVTGEASKAIRWVAHVATVEVSD